MIFRFVAVFTLAVLMAFAAFGHGNKKHVMGTVERIGSTSVIVKTTQGKSVEVKLVPSTAYILRTGSEDKSAKLSDLAVGDKVVIHATPSGDALSADEIKFSRSPQKNSN
jgi:hypothetical protein